MNHNRTVCSCVFRYGSALLTLAAIACSSPPETLQTADMMGQWKNVDSKTDHLTRVEIHQSDSTDQFLVRMWGACHPEDCFWGDNTGAVIVDEANSRGIPDLSLEWEFESSTSEQRIQLIGKNLLQIDTHTRLRQPDLEFDVTDRFRRTGKP